MFAPEGEGRLAQTVSHALRALARTCRSAPTIFVTPSSTQFGHHSQDGRDGVGSLSGVCYSFRLGTGVGTVSDQTSCSPALSKVGRAHPTPGAFHRPRSSIRGPLRDVCGHSVAVLSSRGGHPRGL